MILERGEHIGQSWRHRYDGLRLNSARWMSSLPGYVMERRYGDFPSRDDWVDYLERYAERYRVAVAGGIEVWRIDRAPGLGWRVQTNRGELGCRFVVIATGMDHTPQIPAWRGKDGFEGNLLHSAEYRNAVAFQGRDVLVVGARNSATEIAHQLSERAAKVWIAVRTPPLILPRRFLGVSITAWAIPAIPLPDRLLDAISRAAQRASFGDLSRYGIPPPSRGISAQRREGYVAPVDSGFVAAVKRGAIEVTGPRSSVHPR